MKKNILKSSLCRAVLCAAALVASTATLQAQSYTQSQPQSQDGNQLKIGVVNFKSCVENSKLGRQEQASFEAMKKQMESILEDKEKEINDLATKLNDPDYLDSITPEAERELKHKFRAQSQEFAQQQNQYLQTLQQANVKILQKLADTISKASGEVAKEMGINLVINDDSAFFYLPTLDISKQTAAKMDINFSQETHQ